MKIFVYKSLQMRFKARAELKRRGETREETVGREERDMAKMKSSLED
jgi:hypothetical protein